MADELKSVEALRRKIEDILRQKKLSYEVKPNGAIWVRKGSTVVVITTGKWGKRMLVKLAAPVALNITKITPELTRFLVEKNFALLFGKFSLDTKGKGIWYEHVLLGDFMDVDEFLVAISAVAITADEYDEQVSKMAKGKRVADL